MYLWTHFLGEFGYISGTLAKLGSDVLLQISSRRNIAFQQRISLIEQSVEAGDQSLNLQSGMGFQQISNSARDL